MPYRLRRGATPAAPALLRWRGALPLAAVILLLIGCKSTEQKVLDETLALHEQAYQLLKDNVDNPAKATELMIKLEEDSREQRKKLRTDGTDALKKLSEEAKKTWYEDSNRRFEEYATKFGTVLKRYEGQARDRLQALVSQITH